MVELYFLYLIFWCSILLAFFVFCHQFREKKCLPSQPHIIILKIEELDMNKYVYTFSVPPAGAPDVIKREFHYMVNGVTGMAELDMDVISYEMIFDEDAEVEIYMIDIDDAGNRSLASDTLKFTVVDTIPPPAPAKPDIMDVKEVIVVDPMPEEPVMEEPVDPMPEEPVIVDEPIMGEPMPEEPVADGGADIGGEANTNV